MSAHISGIEANKTSYSHRADFGLYKNLNKNMYYSRVARHRYLGLYVNPASLSEVLAEAVSV
jgi:hypothetical protein